jgi:glycosyltransferase involved in cell wall biosynthesis
MRNSSVAPLAIVGPFRFPDCSAAARRILGLGLSLKHAGFKVLIGSGQSGQLVQGQRDNCTSTFSVFSLGEIVDSRLPRFHRLARLFVMGIKTMRWLSTLDPRPGTVFLYGGYTLYARFLVPWCYNNRVPCVVDVVEWFEPSHLPGGWWGPFHWNVEIALRYYYVRAKNIIAISRYLENYYKGRSCHTLRMPPTLDVFSIPARLIVSAGPVTLAYAGFPGQKDLLGNVIEALLRMDPEGKWIRFVVAGPKPEDILNLLPLKQRGLSTLPACLEVLGPLPHEQVMELIKNADFVPLLRPPLRYAQAGFPTKVPESLALGTPVICNLTSDLGDYIHDGQEGIICSDHSAEAFGNALERALTLTPYQREEMRRAARIQAERSFDYRAYVTPLAEFLEGLQLCA